MLTKFLQNPEALDIFGGELALDQTVLSKLSLDYNGPTANMTLLLPLVPSNPPEKWRGRSYDAVALELQAMAVEGIELTGWSTINDLSITMTRSELQRINISAVGTGVDIQIECGWLRLVGLTPFHRS